MGFEKKLIREGDGTTIPKKNDLVAMEYTGWLFDESKPNNKGTQFDSSVERGDLETLIGIGRVIKGWDEGIQTMSLGEKATLTISSDFAYGARGFPGIIPPNSTLIFDVELKKVKQG